MAQLRTRLPERDLRDGLKAPEFNR
jgi:hypothetical protein